MSYESSGNIQNILPTWMSLNLIWRRSLDIREFRVYMRKKYEEEEQNQQKLDEICSLLRRQFIFLLAYLQFMFSR